MARALKGIMTLCLALGLTSLASGQGQDRQQPREPPVLGPVLSNPEVRKELKLSEEQVGKLKDALVKVTEKFKDDVAKFQRMSPEEQQKKMKAFSEDSNKAISGVLDAKQWKRFKQIQWQINGVGALQDQDLQKELKLSDDQKKKLDDIFNDANKKLQEMMKSRETPQEQYRTLFQDVDKKVNAVLTEDQQKNLKDLKGPPFQASRPAGPPPPSDR